MSTETLYKHGDPVLTRPGAVPLKAEFVSASRQQINSLLSDEEKEETDGSVQRSEQVTAKGRRKARS